MGEFKVKDSVRFNQLLNELNIISGRFEEKRDSFNKVVTPGLLKTFSAELDKHKKGIPKDMFEGVCEKSRKYLKYGKVFINLLVEEGVSINKNYKPIEEELKNELEEIKKEVIEMMEPANEMNPTRKLLVFTSIQDLYKNVKELDKKYWDDLKKKYRVDLIDDDLSG